MTFHLADDPCSALKLGAPLPAVELLMKLAGVDI